MAHPLIFEGLLGLGANQIRQHGAGSVAVSIRLLEMLSVVMAATDVPERRQDVMAQAEMVYRMASASTEETADRSAIAQRFTRLRALVTEAGEPATRV